MPASSPNPEAGRRLRGARERLGLSTRDVERLSRAFADTKQNQEYYISHVWLSQIEKGELTPGLYKTYTLSTIYQYRFDEVLTFFGIQLGDLGREQLRQPLPHTQLVGSAADSPEIPHEHLQNLQLERTDLVSRMFRGLARLEADLFPRSSANSSVYGYVGTKDFTLFPLIRPGSFVEIDSSQRRIESGRWSSVYDRPIYFTELRDEYACSWCEENDGNLLLIPYPQTGCKVREFRSPAQAEVIGRVTAVTMRIAELPERRVGTP